MNNSETLWRLWPRERLGWWAAACGAAGLLFILLVGNLAMAKVPLPFRALSGLLPLLCVSVGSILGWISLARRDRSLVLLATTSVVTVFFVSFGISELLVPR